MIRLTVTDGKVGHGVPFERIRRITGYLVGTLDRFNDAKRAEVGDRIKHGLSRSLAPPEAKLLLAYNDHMRRR